MRRRSTATACSRVIFVVEGTVDVNDVTVTGGNSGAGQSPDTQGGGIYVEGASSLALRSAAPSGETAPPRTAVGSRWRAPWSPHDSTISGNQCGTADPEGKEPASEQMGRHPHRIRRSAATCSPAPSRRAAGWSRSNAGPAARHVRSPVTRRRQAASADVDVRHPDALEHDRRLR